MPNLLDFSGRTVVVTGAASGMGNETARLLLDAGAEVHAIDVAPVELDVAAAHRCDLSDPAAIDATVADLPARADVLMNCAGIPNGGHWTPLQIMQMNILGLRHVTDALIDRIPSGGSVTNVASIAGNTWTGHVAELTELLETSDFAAGTVWCEHQPGRHGQVLRLTGRRRRADGRRRWPCAQKEKSSSDVKASLSASPHPLEIDRR